MENTYKELEMRSKSKVNRYFYLTYHTRIILSLDYIMLYFHNRYKKYSKFICTDFEFR